MNYETYQKELNLILKQTRTESDLYSVLPAFLKSLYNFKELSLRNISNKRIMQKNSNCLFYALGSFPDFALLSEEFDYEKPTKKDILGVVEVKNISEDLSDFNFINIKYSELSNEKKRIINYILCFNKVLLTNGIDWYYYEINLSEEEKNKIGLIQEQIYTDMQNKKESDFQLKDDFVEELTKGISGWRLTLGIYDKNQNRIKWFMHSEWESLLQKLKSIVWIDAVNYIKNTIIEIWKENVKRDYYDIFLIQEDTLKCSLYHHIRARLDDFFKIHNIAILTEFRGNKFLEMNYRPDIVIVKMKENGDEPYFVNRIDKVLFAIELKYKDDSNGSINDIISDCDKIKCYAKKFDNDVQFILAVIQECFWENKFWLDEKDEKLLKNRVTELVASFKSEDNKEMEFLYNSY